MRVQLFTQLQAIDQQLSGLARERDEVLARYAERDVLRELRERRRQYASVLKEQRGRSSDLQWELDDVELRLQTLHEQDREGPTDPLVAREVVLLREQRARLEEQVLQLLDEIDVHEQQLRSADQQFEQAAKLWNEHEPQLQSQLDRLGHELEQLQARRQQFVSQLPTGSLELYDDLQRRHRGTALASIRNRQCSACRARLPAAVFDLLNTPDPLIRCPRCGRVLYIDETANS